MDAQRHGERIDSTAEQSQPRKITYDEFQPTSVEWSEEPLNHVLRIDLPGFRRGDLNVQVDSTGKITIRGKRQVAGSRYSLLEQVFGIPKDSNIDRITGRLDSGRLTLVMPKKEAEGKGSSSPPVPTPSIAAISETLKSANGEVLASTGKGEEDCVMNASALKDRMMEMIYENKKIIVVAAVAFTIGFYISRRM